MPVGVPPVPLTFAVKLTDCPYAEGLREEASVTVVLAGPITNVPVATP